MLHNMVFITIKRYNNNNVLYKKNVGNFYFKRTR